MKSIFNKTSIYLSAVMILLVSACQLDDTTISSVPELEYSSIEKMADKIGVEEQVFSVSSDEMQEIVGSNGLKIMIPQNAFRTNSGDEINGMVDVKLKEIMTKSKMVLSNKPTEADGVMLETVGTFLIEAFQGDHELTIEETLEVELNANSNVSDPTDLGVYYGTSLADGSVNWVLDSGSEVPLNANVYTCDVENLNWVTCAQPLESASTHKLTISTEAISNLSDQQGFLIFDNAATVAKLIPEGNNFVRNDFPAGKTASVVMIALDPLFIYLSVTPGVNLTSDQTINANYNTVTEEELISTIEGLN